VVEVLSWHSTSLQTLGCDVVVAQVPIPDTTVLVELYLYDTAGCDIGKVRK